MENSIPQLEPDLWVDRYADYLYNFTIARVNDETIAADLVQETFLAALKSAPSFKGESNERTWLVAILKRKIIDHYRKMSSAKGKAEVRMDFGDFEDDRGNWMENRVSDSLNLNAEEAMENEELGAAILECMSKLPEKQYQVFRMKTIEGLDTETICNELQITPSNLWVIIHRARTSLIQCLEKNWF